jgi:chloride channel 3/4/5
VELSLSSELDAFGGDFDVMWRGFVTSVIAAVALQYVDPFRTSKLVLFQVCFNPFRFRCYRFSNSLRPQVTSISDTWLAFELVCTFLDVSWHAI